VVATQPVPGDDAAGRWRRVRDELAGRGPAALTRSELDLLADAWFWLDDPDTSVDVRREAYRAHVDAGDARAAALAAWRLFYEHFLVGEQAVATGWLERCRRHAVDCDDETVTGWLAVADADRAARAGDHAAAVELSLRAGGLGRRTGEADLTAMALQIQARARLDLGERAAGLALLDEVMIAVINDELQPLFTGWVFCNVVSTCYSIADLQRACEWSEAALRWCSTMREGLMYPGLCRVYAVELAYLRGEWRTAIADAERACAELTLFDPRYAGEAFALVGDLHRLRGELAEAEAAYARAHELGYLPQPGLALVRSAQGRPGEAMAALRAALQPGPNRPLPRAQLLAAMVDVAVAVTDGGALAAAAEELTALARAAGSGLIDALAAAARGERALFDGDAATGWAELRTAADSLREQGFPYESARRRSRAAAAARALGDTDTARGELAGAIAVFTELGAALDLTTTAAPAASGRPANPLSPREVDVLRRVAAGRTDHQIAGDLQLSPHTVARHMTNIRTKLGVGSRAAATALASERGWLGG
jgi:DNA-binding CsgD family transcriptional regulator/tetratricopeptide (TPR) repeat protein